MRGDLVRVRVPFGSCRRGGGGALLAALGGPGLRGGDPAAVVRLAAGPRNVCALEPAEARGDQIFQPGTVFEQHDNDNDNDNDNDMSNITNDRMNDFIRTICDQVHEALNERADDMLRAWHENIEEAQDNDGKFPPLKVGMAATVDIEAAKIETTLSFTAKYQTKISAPMRDPNQPDLPGTEGQEMARELGMTIKVAGGKLV
jgi:hypothetical protein